MSPTIIMGDVGRHDAEEFRTALKSASINRIDTAALYMKGESEKKLGKAGLAKDFTIDTKILYTPPGDHTLTSEAIEQSLLNSLAVLGLQQVNVLYCHAPDYATPIEIQAKAFDEQYRLGRFKFLGVSNFPPSMVQEWLDVADREGYVKPSYYEGQYNVVCRGYEKTLFPLLRKNNMHFAGYSPMAGGFLLGRGARMDDPKNPYSAWYGKPGMKAAAEKFLQLSESTGLRPEELCLRWEVYHSALQDGDVIILGASKLSHISTNAKQIAAGPLDKEIAESVNEVWKLCEEDGIAILKSFEKGD